MSYNVCCVIGDSTQDEIVQYIQYQCREASIQFRIRHYDSWTYAEDRDNITSLPAFHIYKGRNRHKITFGAEEDPLDKIKDYIRQKHEKNDRKVRWWRQWFGFIRRPRYRTLTEWPRR